MSAERVQVVEGPDELAEAAARAAVADLEAAVEAHGSATWVLKDFPNRVDAVVGCDVIDDQVDDPAPTDFLAVV